MEQYTLSDTEYKSLTKLIFKKSGIDFGASRKHLLKSRINPILSKLKLNTYKDYIDLVSHSESTEQLIEMIDEVSNPHTFFFRHKKQFDFFRKDALQKITLSKTALGEKELNLWCTASASGEEAYSLVICLLEELGLNSTWEINLLATDISTRSIKTAERGIYCPDQVKDIDLSIIYKYFERREENNNEFFEVKETLKKQVSFTNFNLITSPFVFEKKFDFIFCRNVMIYFNQKDQGQLEFKLINALNKEGYLFLGDSESLSVANSCLIKHLGQSIYQKY